MKHTLTQICAALLAVVMLAGCVPANITSDSLSADVQDPYIEKAPLVAKQDKQIPDQPSAPETEQSSDTPADPETETPAETPVTDPQEPSDGQSQTGATTDPEESTDSQSSESTGTQQSQTDETNATQSQESQPSQDTTVSTEEGVSNEAVVLPSGNAAIPDVAKPVASGTQVNSNGEAIIDYSNIKDGYVMVQYTVPCEQRLKVQVKGPSTTYTYNLTPQQWAAFPLSDDNGDYQVVIYKNVVDTKYAAVLSQSFSVAMEDEFAPYIRSNQYVNFEAAPATVATAASLAGGISDPLQKVAAIYNFVVYGMCYDTELAASVTSTYLPDLDSVLAKMSGICFDYAALMTGMLRSQGVPTKLIIGYAGDVYHAWINVWSASTGWVEGAVYFDGVNWQRMDPTFASAGGSGVMDYIGDGSNYSGKYFY